MSWTLFWQLMILIPWTSIALQPVAKKFSDTHFVNNVTP
jgi:hypothetical protein